MYESHKGKFKMSPMTELMFTMCGSAFMFHMTKSRFKMTGEAANPASAHTVAPAPVPKQQDEGGGGMPFVGNLMSNMARAMSIPSMPAAQPTQMPAGMPATMPAGMPAGMSAGVGEAMPNVVPTMQAPVAEAPTEVPAAMQLPPDIGNIAAGMLNNPQIMSMMTGMLGSMGGMGGMGGA